MITILGCDINIFPFLWFSVLTFCSHYRWKYNLSSWWRDVSGMIPKNVGRIHKIWEARPFKEFCMRKNSIFILGRSSLLGRQYLQSQYWDRDFSCLGLGRWKSSKVLSGKYSDKSSNKNSRKKRANSIHVWIVIHEGSYTGESSDKDVKLSRDVWSGSDNCTGTPD